MGAHVRGAAFSAADILTVPAGGEGNVGAVVGSEEDDGVVELADVIDLLDDLADEFVEVLHHGDEVGFLGGFVLGLLVRGVRAGSVADGVGGGHEGIVDEDGGVVDEEGVVFVAADEVAKEVGHEVGPVFEMVVFLGEELAVLFEGRGPESLAASFPALLGGNLPEAIFIEAGFDGAGGVLVAGSAVVEAAELPFAGDGGFIACGLEEVGEGFLLGMEVAEVGVVSEVVFSGHEFDAGGGADGGGVAVVEADALGSEGIEVGRFIVFGTVAGEAFPRDVIGHDEDDVGFLFSKEETSAVKDEGEDWKRLHGMTLSRRGLRETTKAQWGSPLFF